MKNSHWVYSKSVGNTWKSDAESKVLLEILYTTHKSECTQIILVSHQWRAKTVNLRDANDTHKACAIWYFVSLNSKWCLNYNSWLADHCARDSRLLAIRSNNMTPVTSPPLLARCFGHNHHQAVELHVCL
jgi:hypothetical protein